VRYEIKDEFNDDVVVVTADSPEMALETFVREQSDLSDGDEINVTMVDSNGVLYDGTADVAWALEINAWCRKKEAPNG
jgi:hypothetical protein